MMDKIEFKTEVRKHAPNATDSDIESAISGREDTLSRNLARAVGSRLSDASTVSVAGGQKQGAKKTSKLSAQLQTMQPMVGTVTNKLQADIATSVTQTVEFVNELAAKVGAVEDRLADEVAAIVSPEAMQNRVLLKAGAIAAEHSGTVTTANNLLSGMDDALLALDDSALTVDVQGIEAWLVGEEQKATRAIAAAVEG